MRYGKRGKRAPYGPRKKTSFTLTIEGLALLEHLSQTRDMTQSYVLEEAIRAMASQQGTHR